MTTQLEELASLYVLDRLDAAERAAFEARLAGDAALAALVHELEAALEARLRLLPRFPPPPGLLARIESRLDADTAPAAAPRPAANPWWTAVARWGMAAAFAVAAGAATFFYLDRHRAAPAPTILIVGLDPRQSALAEVSASAFPGDADGRFVQLASLATHYWDHPANLPVKLGPADGDSRAYALFDPASRQGFIAIQQLPLTAPGQRYHLWIADAATHRAYEAGVLPADAARRGLFFFALAPGSGPAGRLNFFITAEDAAVKPTQPRGPIVLGERDI